MSSDTMLIYSDIYIVIVSSAHNVCPKGYYIAIVSTIAEGSSNHHLELQPGFDRLGRIEEKFMGPAIPLYEPLESGMNDNIFISKSYDATSHFETTTGTSPVFSCLVIYILIRFRQMMSRISTGAQRGMSLSSKACGKGRTLLPRSKRVAFLVYRVSHE